MEYSLSNTLVSGYNSTSVGDRPKEVISLNFTRIEIIYKTYDEQHVSTGRTIGHYDLGQARIA